MTHSRRQVALVSVAAVILALASWLVIAHEAQLRPVDHDEGFYLQAAAQIDRGNVPYCDFFFPQMPLTPWIYHFAATAPGQVTLAAGRELSAIFTGLLVALVVVAGLLTRGGSARGRLTAGVLMGAAVLVNSFVISWHAMVKTHALEDLLAVMALLATALAISVVHPRRRLWACAGAGAALGLAVLAKLYVAALALPLVLALTAAALGGSGGYATSSRRQRVAAAVKIAMAYGAGLLLALTPALWLAAQAPEQFLWDNLGYHRATDLWRAASSDHRRTSAAGGLWELAKFLGRPGNFALAMMAAAGLVVTFRDLRRAGPDTGPLWARCASSLPIMAAACALLLTLVFVGVMAPFSQYWVITVPMLTLCAAPIFAGIVDGKSGTRRALVALAVVATLAVALRDHRRQRRRWSDEATPSAIDTPEAVARVTHLLSSAGDQLRARKLSDEVVTLWPGYAAAAGVPLTSGGDGGIFTYRLPQGGRGPEEQRVLDPEKLRALLVSGQASLVVAGIDWPAELTAALDENYLPFCPYAEASPIYLLRSLALVCPTPAQSPR
jgi:hypothetical protein